MTRRMTDHFAMYGYGYTTDIASPTIILRWISEGYNNLEDATWEGRGFKDRE